MPRTAANKINSVRAVTRAIEILQAFSPDRPSMSVLEIEKKVRLSRPTLYRLLETLASKALIRAHGTPQRFSLDYGVGRIAQNWMSGLDPIEAARPILEQLHGATAETVLLFVLREHQHVCVWELPSPHPLAVTRGIGPVSHISSGASGKAILAFMNDDAVAALLRTLPKGIDGKALLAELAAIRRDKFKVSRGEVMIGAVSIAAPYFDHTSRVVGSIAVVGPEARLTEDWITKTARRVAGCAVELSAVLGHRTEAKRGRSLTQNSPRAE
jgi:DNA-binding IclR family transcriptional regulator